MRWEDEEIDSLFPRNIISCSTYILSWSTEKTEYLTKDLEKLTKSKANEMDAQNPIEAYKQNGFSQRDWEISQNRKLASKGMEDSSGSTEQYSLE